MSKYPVWLNKLPPPDVEYTYAPSNCFVRTTLTNGRARQRRITNNPPVIVDVRWKIPRELMADFRYLVHEIIGKQCGWGFFYIPLAFDSGFKKVKARFIDGDSPYKVTNESNVLWTVTAQLETFDVGLLDQEEFKNRNPDFKYSE
ncbi:hypothetical protein [Snodgrassella alvi]|uniref:hypothetical protein n=1 Tax=Snodgrassella alvi TaxID=1196083 RepID=UPI0027429BB9|nr:hypothetical protein [Snodgrassella alvi]WLT02905.1 hypothetical protein RAM00_03540 [Snodgrassella alvi]